MPHDGLQHYISHVNNHTSRNKRFGFAFIDELRQNFCRSFCTSADTMPYFMNIVCAAKCPELYLPHSMTTESTTSISTTVTMTSGIVNGKISIFNKSIQCKKNINIQ